MSLLPVSPRFPFPSTTTSASLNCSWTSSAFLGLPCSPTLVPHLSVRTTSFFLRYYLILLLNNSLCSVSVCLGIVFVFRYPCNCSISSICIAELCHAVNCSCCFSHWCFPSILALYPLLVKAARGEPVSRSPAWMMRQAGRYMAIYRKLAEKHPSFRERSETTDLIVEISLQPWEAFRPDGVIIFSDILTPLPAFGVPFDIEEVRGPVIQTPIRTEEGLRSLHPIDLDKLNFIGDPLKILRQEVGGQAAVLGFVGAPWTIATHIVEGGTTRTYTNIKTMCHTAPNVLKALLSHLAQAISEYAVLQVESGAHCIKIFDSWGGQLPPDMWEKWSKPYINEIVSILKKRCPQTPVVLYINGNGGLLERMKDTGVDVIGLDWTVDMADGRKRLGHDISVQGNVDPVYLFSPLEVLTNEIHRVVNCAGPSGHILNLGHGVLVGTPEEAVAYFFNVARSLKVDSHQEKAGQSTMVVRLQKFA